MLFELILLLLLAIVAFLMIKGKEFKINVTINHKYDAPSPPVQLNPDDLDDKQQVMGAVEALNKFMNGVE